MAVQERNSEMVSLLSADFIQKTDTVYLAGIITGCILALPGLVAFWPMGISLSDSNDIYADYAYLPGRAGGQTLNGGTAAGDDLTLRSTANATKGNIFFGNSTYDEVNNRLGIGRSPAAQALEVVGTMQANFPTDERYSIGVQPLSGQAAIYAYDLTGAVYVPLLFDGSTISLRPSADSSKGIVIEANGNIGVGGNSYGSGVKVVFIANGTAPSGTPTGGGILYVESGALKYKGSSGTVTPVAPA